jgi:hypothetical protein
LPRKSNIFTEIGASRSPYEGIGRGAELSAARIHKTFASASSQSGSTLRILFMTVSSVTAPPPVQILVPSAPKAPDAKTDGSANDASAPQPTVLAPLPPGQGTRIDQLV